MRVVMRYLPILEELFESDTVIIFIIGMTAALLLGFCMKHMKGLWTGVGISILVYGICEIMSNLHGSYMIQFIVLFLGTAALGCTAGFWLGLLWKAISRR